MHRYYHVYGVWLVDGERHRKRQFLKSPLAPADHEDPADENDALATLKKQYLEILHRLDRLHDSLDILTRMSFRSESVPESIHPKGIEQVWLGAVETVTFDSPAVVLTEDNVYQYHAVQLQQSQMYHMGIVAAAPDSGATQNHRSIVALEIMH